MSVLGPGSPVTFVGPSEDLYGNPPGLAKGVLYFVSSLYFSGGHCLLCKGKMFLTLAGSPGFYRGYCVCCFKPYDPGDFCETLEETHEKEHDLAPA